MKTATLLRGMFKRNLIEVTRYGLDLLSGVVVVLVIFAAIFFGAKALAPGTTGDTLSGIVAGYLVFVLCFFAFSEATQELIGEAAAGTLEQLALSPFGLVRVLMARFAGALLWQTVMIGSVMLVMMVISGRWLHLNLPTLVPLILLTLAGVYGVGLALGGVALVFKRVTNFLQIVSFGFIALVAVPADRLPVLKLLPVTLGSELIDRAMVRDLSIFDMEGSDLLFLVANAALWLAFGIAAFQVCERVARDRALLGHY